MPVQHSFAALSHTCLPPTNSECCNKRLSRQAETSRLGAALHLHCMCRRHRPSSNPFSLGVAHKPSAWFARLDHTKHQIGMSRSSDAFLSFDANCTMPNRQPRICRDLVRDWWNPFFSFSVTNTCLDRWTISGLRCLACAWGAMRYHLHGD